MRYYHMYVRRIVFVLGGWANHFRMFGLPMLLLLLVVVEAQGIVLWIDSGSYTMKNPVGRGGGYVRAQ